MTPPSRVLVPRAAATVGDVGRPLLLFDADCGFCTRAAALAPKLRLETDVRPLQSLAPADLAALGVSPERAMREIPLVMAPGRVCYGHQAIAGALATGGRLARLAAGIMLTWPIDRLAAAVYRLVGKLRHKLPGGTPNCRVTPANPRESAPSGSTPADPPR